MNTFKIFLLENMSEEDFYVKRGLQKIPKNEYLKIIETDPDYKRGSVGKYSTQVLLWYKQILNDNNKKEYFLDNIHTIFTDLDEFMTKISIIKKKFPEIKGIQDIKDINHLHDIVLSISKEKTRGDIKRTGKTFNENEAKILFENDEWIIADVYTVRIIM